MLKSNKVTIKSFQELSNSELYAIMALRLEVFVVEQDCPYQDLDGLDQHATHVFIDNSEKIVAYARILNKNEGVYQIGRVVVAKNFRGKNLATIIMQQCVDYCQLKNDAQHIELSAQSYLHDFYQGIGFKSVGKYYLEDDIPHEKMRLSL
ncbi:MAG TPA: GNAT family N-acetyltransferase [Oceanospirillales bacterium]|nr:GNAT family N-acetyltransferase [Oceanospirillales bacterium]